MKPIDTSYKVSVIMGIYNCADTLSTAIDSIIAQTYEHWELIMCDDSSADSTFTVAEKYKKQYPDKIKLLQNSENRGLNYTLNRCLAEAEGDYIARMDGDDISLPQRFEVEVGFLNSHTEYSVVSCPMIRFDSQGDWSCGGGSCHEPNPEMLVRGTVHCHAPCMVRRNVLEDVDGYSEDKRLLRVEDWHLWLKIYKEGYRGYNLSEPLYKMRDDRNAAGRRKFKYRLNESYVSAMAVKTFHLPLWNYIFILRPIIVGLLPFSLYNYLHRKKSRNRKA